MISVFLVNAAFLPYRREHQSIVQHSYLRRKAGEDTREGQEVRSPRAPTNAPLATHIPSRSRIATLPTRPPYGAARLPQQHGNTGALARRDLGTQRGALFMTDAHKVRLAEFGIDVCRHGYAPRLARRKRCAGGSTLSSAAALTSS